MGEVPVEGGGGGGSGGGGGGGWRWRWRGDVAVKEGEVAVEDR